jgi:superfamily II DNA or RNA helicase
MPQIFDNISNPLLATLQNAIGLSERADFCVGYFNLRGWRQLDSHIENWSGGEGHCCRLLVGMQRLPEDDLRSALRPLLSKESIDNPEAIRLKKKLAEEFRTQLQIGAPTDADEAGLRRLARQIRAKKVIVKLFLHYPLHAKLYLLQRPDPISPKLGFLGSSNLTMAGLAGQGELNVDITDHDAWDKLSRWFLDRWNDRLCMDISEELAQIIESSWARETQPPPYHIYLKMAYHLAADARLSEEEFDLPDQLNRKLLDFQKAAVKLALRKINQQGGVMIGDVVGLGKTLVGSAIAKCLQEEKNHETLIICPKNLVSMWEDYRIGYGINAKVMALSLTDRQLKDEKRFRTVLIDESHNLRNRETTKYKAIRDYLERNSSDVILLTATPYNKTLLDLSSQLRLFLDSDTQLPVRPENFIRQRGLDALFAQTQADPHTIVAFEKSDLAEDWRLLMDQFLVRRTRGFIKKNYAKMDPENGRPYLLFTDGRRSYFPDRIPKSVKFPIDESNPADQYARMFSDQTLTAVNALHLPRYGLGNYVKAPLYWPDNSEKHKEIVDDLSRAGKHLIGFCRTSLFKRLESSGAAFELTLDRHIQRDQIALYALEHGLDVPIGSSDAGIFETSITDSGEVFDPMDDLSTEGVPPAAASPDEIATLYTSCRANKQYRWLPAAFFEPALAEHLREDIAAMENITSAIGLWKPRGDSKLIELVNLLKTTHPREKVLIFTQYADTANYLFRQLQRADIRNLAAVTGDSDNPTAIARRFSPESNEARHEVSTADEVRVLISTDVLSEGQNLQDCAIIVNYDLPWALVRLIQRVGRVDRIGQQSHQILCYSFLPADGVERIIRLHQRIQQRQRQEGEVIGSDEMFIEGDPIKDLELFANLYNERAGALDEQDEAEVDISSFANEIWLSAIKDNPKLAAAIAALPDVVYSTRAHQPAAQHAEGVITFVQSAQGNNSLIFLDRRGNIITESPKDILKAAQCEPDAPAIERLPEHHGLVTSALTIASKDQNRVGGQLGGTRSVRRKLYDRLKTFYAGIAHSLFKPPDLDKVIDEIYRFPLKDSARDTLARRIREGISDEELTKLCIDLRSDNSLCNISETPESIEPHIICSMGLRSVGPPG